MSYACKNCGRNSQVTVSKSTLDPVGNPRTIRTRRCAHCSLQWTTAEVQVGENHERIDHSAIKNARQELRIQEAFTAGRPMVTDPAPCPFCGHDHIHGTSKGGSCTGRYGDNYWRAHECRACHKWFYTSTDLMTGRTKVHRKALSANEMWTLKNKEALERAALNAAHSPAPLPTEVTDELSQG